MKESGLHFISCSVVPLSVFAFKVALYYNGLSINGILYSVVTIFFAIFCSAL